MLGDSDSIIFPGNYQGLVTLVCRDDNFADMLAMSQGIIHEIIKDFSRYRVSKYLDIIDFRFDLYHPGNIRE